jgi:hypothetical protein
VKENEHITWIEVNINGHISKAINYKDFSGNVCLGDKVVLNTTGVDLNLGTGGYHFVMYNYSSESKNIEGPGHIMKLRYTPYQMKCLAAEEEISPYHKVFNEFKSLENHIFIVATLHSMIAPISAMIKYLNSDININYIMTDGGALPLNFSNTVSELKEKGIINNTITIGHAFGGDLECINIYTGLIAAKEILKGDVTIISMGPGIVGSGTKYGFTGVEQGSIIDAINNLGGRAIAVPRISFKDKRDRHRGISHHTITILSEITNTKAYCVLPYLEDTKEKFITNQIELSKIGEKHSIVFQDGKEILDAMSEFNLNTTSMGRTIKDDIEYFIALGAVGRFVVSLLEWRSINDI